MQKLNSHKDLQKIFETNYKQLVIQSLRIVNKEDAAEDLVQECFIKLWKKKEELQITGNINAYLARMVRNKSLDFIKKRRIVTTQLDETYQGRSELGDYLESEDLKNEIDKTLENLPEKCRQVFVLSRFEDMSYKEISEQLDISKKTVEAHISKALKVFRSSLKQFMIIIFKKNKGRG